MSEEISPSIVDQAWNESRFLITGPVAREAGPRGQTDKPRPGWIINFRDGLVLYATYSFAVADKPATAPPSYVLHSDGRVEENIYAVPQSLTIHRVFLLEETPAALRPHIARVAAAMNKVYGGELPTEFSSYR